MTCRPVDTIAVDVHLEQALQDAIARSELFVDYQPVFRLQTGDMTGVEALVRWRHPERGVLSPVAFIPLA